MSQTIMQISGMEIPAIRKYNHNGPRLVKMTVPRVRYRSPKHIGDGYRKGFFWIDRWRPLKKSAHYRRNPCCFSHQGRPLVLQVSIVLNSVILLFKFPGFDNNGSFRVDSPNLFSSPKVGLHFNAMRGSSWSICPIRTQKFTR